MNDAVFLDIIIIIVSNMSLLKLETQSPGEAAFQVCELRLAVTR